MITKHLVSALGEELPLLGLGGMRLPKVDSGEIDFDSGRDMVDLCMKNGVNYFDTAYPYHDGESEVFFRKALVERYDREDFFLADKMPEWLVTSPDEARKIFEEQLEKCGVEYFDFYLLHALNAERIHALKTSGCEEFLLKMKDGMKLMIITSTLLKTRSIVCIHFPSIKRDGVYIVLEKQKKALNI